MRSASITSRILGSPSELQDFAAHGEDPAVDYTRRCEDRRSRHLLLSDWRWSYRGRRKSIRRTADSSRVILDWYHPSLLFFIVTTYLLSGIDAILTLTLLEMGVATEANPFMQILLAENVRLFAGVKSLVTGVGLICLALYSNHCLFTRLRVDRLIYALFTMYCVLVAYEVQLLRMAESTGWSG
jgi:hypothetical protein